MEGFLRTLPPAGTPLGTGETLRFSAAASISPGDGESLRTLRGRIARRLELGDAESVAAAGSGRALLSLLLEELARDRPGRTEVVVPGYTCYSVAASIVRAGLRVRPLEIDPTTLSYAPRALEQLDSSAVLALISANLFGLPDDLEALERFGQERDLHLIDDAAQALGARVAGRPVGSFGIAGLLSLDKGKPLTTLRGGLLATRDEALAQRVTRRVEAPGGARTGGVAVRLADAGRVLGYGLFLRPRLYWILDRTLDLGRTVYDPSFPIHPFPAHLAPMGLKLLEGLDEVNRARATVAGRILDRLPGGTGIQVPSPARADAEVVRIRLPILMPDGPSRERALARLRSAGLGATGSYPRALVDVEGLRPHLAPDLVDTTPRAREVADRILTLPTHPYVTPGDVERIVAGLADD